jgi:hypothetical protein
MRAVHWLALGAGAVLGVLAACFTPPDLTGPYKCNQGQCGTPDLSCVDGLCCKLDGGDPACPPPVVVPDGGPDDAGPDASSDSGSDSGFDAGCTVPSDAGCSVDGQDGGCAAGLLECDAGALWCRQVGTRQPEICNSKDDDCDGVVDNYPCQGAPPDFLTPSPDYVTGAERTNVGDVGGMYTACLHNNGSRPATAEYLDGGRWKGTGITDHFFWAEKADGGTWSLMPNQKLMVNFSGMATQNPNYSSVISMYWQPVIWLCAPGGGWRRFNPNTDQVLPVIQGSVALATNVVLNPASGASQFFPPNGTLGDPLSISRVEVQIGLQTPYDGGTPGFDVDITRFGFSPR